MADIQAGLKNVVVLAKKHPVIAVVVVGGAGLLGYIAYKSGGGGGGSSGESSSNSDSGILSGSGFSGSGGSVGGGFSGGAPGPSGGGGTTPLPSGGADYSSLFTPPAPSGGGNSGGGGGSTSGIYDSVESGYTPNAAPDYHVKAYGMKQKTAKEIPSANKTKDSHGKFSPDKLMTKPGDKTPMGYKTGESGKKDVKPNPKPIKKDDTSTPKPKPGMTPAAALGWPRLYTGWIKGVFYTLGYPSIAPGSTTGTGKNTKWAKKGAK